MLARDQVVPFNRLGEGGTGDFSFGLMPVTTPEIIYIRSTLSTIDQVPPEQLLGDCMHEYS